MDFKPLVSWFEKNQRELPWRKSRDPYRVLVSEIMLQQTQVKTVIPYFEKFVKQFPSLKSLKSATEQEILLLWQGMGYYRRAKNLLKIAQQNSEIPNTIGELLQLPGIGEYTAGAIASIAYDLPYASVDGNVERVIARLTADPSERNQLRFHAKSAIENVMNQSQLSPGKINESLMELGATICRPIDPKCDQCPMSNQCKAKAVNQMDSFPHRKPTEKLINLTHVCVVPKESDSVGVKQIPEGRWWGGMWEFPRISKENGELIEDCLNTLGFPDSEKKFSIAHNVTKYKINLEVYLAKRIPENLKKVSIKQLRSYPMPSPQQEILKRIESI